MELDIQQINDNRMLYDSIGNLYPAENSVSVSEERIENIICHWFRPENPIAGELVIFVHGGGYAIGSIQSHKAMVTHFAKALNRNLLFVDYALAPEKPYPHGLNDVVTIYAWATKKFPDNKLYLFGDSAGGGLIISSIYEIQKKSLRQPDAVALISPWYNLKTDNPSADERQHLDLILNKEMVRNFAYAYAGDDFEKADPGALHFTLFPPTYIAVGTNEILHDDSINLYNMIYPIQSKTKLKIYEGQGHVWPQMDIEGQATKELLNEINYFFNNH